MFYYAVCHSVQKINKGQRLIFIFNIIQRFSKNQSKLNNVNQSLISRYQVHFFTSLGKIANKGFNKVAIISIYHRKQIHGYQFKRYKPSFLMNCCVATIVRKINVVNFFEDRGKL